MYVHRWEQRSRSTSSTKIPDCQEAASKEGASEEAAPKEGGFHPQARHGGHEPHVLVGAGQVDVEAACGAQGGHPR